MGSSLGRDQPLQKQAGGPPGHSEAQEVPGAANGSSSTQKHSSRLRLQPLAREVSSFPALPFPRRLSQSWGPTISPTGNMVGPDHSFTTSCLLQERHLTSPITAPWMETTRRFGLIIVLSPHQRQAGPSELC